MPTGKVKWFDESRGFGFITPDDSGDDLFVYRSDIKRAGYATLEEGQKVTFKVRQGKDRLLVHVYVSGLIPIDNVADGIVGLYRALNKYHICCRGRGLTIEEWHMLVPGSKSLEVPV